jgi:hypothetical protein
MPSENQFYTEKLNKLKDSISGADLGSLAEKIPFLKGIPMHPTNAIFRCLGMWPKNASFEILDRFIRIGYDFRVTQADGKCLFNVFEDEE